MKVLSCSLWGAKAPYTVGAIRNAELALAVYPGWVCRFYCGTSVPAATLQALADMRHVQWSRSPSPATGARSSGASSGRRRRPRGDAVA